VSQQLGQDSWPSLRETIKPFWVAENKEQDAPAVQGNEWTTVKVKRSKRSCKAELMGVATALADLASTSNTYTDDVMGVLNDKLQKLSLASGLAAPTCTIVANPPVTARQQNKRQIQPAAVGGPTAKTNTRMAKQLAKQKKQQQKVAKQAAIGG
jgi:hypothetical protein